MEIVTKKAARHVTNPRFSSVLFSHVKFILTERYQNKKSVESVVRSLAASGAGISRKCFQEFLGRVLRRLTDEQALGLGLDPGLLHAIRVRLGLPRRPASSGIIAGKPLARFDARSRHRRIVPLRERLSSRAGQKAQPPVAVRGDFSAVAAVRPRVVPASGSDQTSGGQTKDMSEFSAADWKAANRRALAKIDAARAMHVLTNDLGRTIDMRTQEDIEETELIRLYGMTLEEARSCYQSL